jgi:hypothetical protein
LFFLFLLKLKQLRVWLPPAYLLYRDSMYFRFNFLIFIEIPTATFFGIFSQLRRGRGTMGKYSGCTAHNGCIADSGAGTAEPHNAGSVSDGNLLRKQSRKRERRQNTIVSDGGGLFAPTK